MNQVVREETWKKFDSDLKIWRSAFDNHRFFGGPSQKVSDDLHTKELVDMGLAEASEKYPVYVSRVVGHDADPKFMLAVGESVEKPEEYFMTDMFSVRKEAFINRTDARFQKTFNFHQVPRLTGDDVSTFGKYLAAQVNASSDNDVSYNFLIRATIISYC